jgi:hypothetical protein
MTPEQMFTFLCWFLSLLVTRCSEPYALVCPLPVPSPSQPQYSVSRPASPRPFAPFAHRRLPLAGHPRVGK